MATQPEEAIKKLFEAALGDSRFGDSSFPVVL
jgi:hypothetical protein